MKKIFIACDTTNHSVIKKIINNTKSSKFKVGYKFGLEFFYSKNGRLFLSKLDKKKIIFLDLKLNDIPNTCRSAINSIKDLRNLNYITVHINGGYEMIKTVKQAVKKNNKNLKVLGVTVLTSLSSSALKKIGHTKSVNKIVLKQVQLAKKAGLDGVVCSGQEIKLIKKTCKNMEIITPGIRLPGDIRNDQKRVMYPKQAFLNGATSIVIGRSIIRGNIKKNFKKLTDHLK